MFKFDSYVCEGDTATHEVDGFTVTATIYRDDSSDAPDQRDDGFWPSRNPASAGYIGAKPASEFEAQMAKAQETMRAWKADEWLYCGIVVTVSKNGILLTGQYSNALWGIEANYPGSDNAYLGEVAADLVAEAIAEARATLAALCAN